MTTIDRNSVTIEIAERVRTIAAERGVSNETLIAVLGLPDGEARRILDGERDMCVAELARIKVALGVDFGALISNLRCAA